MTRAEVIEATRAFLRAEVLRDATAPLADDEPLLSGGAITSFDLVALTVFLEARFGVRVPDSKVNREHLDTLDQVAGVVLALRGDEPAPPPATPAAATPSIPEVGPGPPPDLLGLAFPSFRRAPLLVLAVIGLGLVGAEGWARARATRPGDAAADHRRMDYSFESYEAALADHDLGRRPKAPGEVRIVFQGDSGTFGSYLDADEACPAVAGRLLAATHPEARIYNVSYFGQTLVKDAAIFQAGLRYEPDVLVMNLCSFHFEREKQESNWLRPPTSIVYNRALFRRFVEASPGPKGQPAPELFALLDVLEQSARTNGIAARTLLSRRFVLARDQVILRPLVTRLSPLPSLVDRARGAKFDKDTCRVFAGLTVNDRWHGHTHRLDERAVVLLETILGRARAAGIEVVLLWAPEPTLPGDPPERIPWTARSWDVLEDLVKRIARDHGCTLVFCRDLLGPLEFLDSEVHWTVEGNAKIGARVAEALGPVVDLVRARRVR